MNAVEYIEAITGARVAVSEPAAFYAAELPLFLRKRKRTFANIEGRDVVFEYRDSMDEETPLQIEKQRDSLEKIFNRPVVFCFEKLESFQRKRLIEKKIAFIHKDKQMYMPLLFIDLKEYGVSRKPERNVFSPAAQCIVLYHLLKQPLDGLVFSDISKLLPYSPMSITRAVQEYLSHGLCDVTGTKEKKIIFKFAPAELWEQSKSLCISPVKKTYYTDEINISRYILSGESALAKYTMVQEPGVPCYAVSRAQMQELKKNNQFLAPYITGGPCIEVWSYDPALLSSDKAADPLSLYLRYLNDEDERIQKAISGLPITFSDIQ